MAELPIIPPTGLDPIQKSAETSSSSKAKEGAPEGPAFRVLLEQLQARAQELEQTTQDVSDPDRLAGAVDTARASLEDALSLSDQILEAFHEARQQADAPAGLDEEISKEAKR
jgi:hypothetical protein